MVAPQVEMTTTIGPPQLPSSDMVIPGRPFEDLHLPTEVWLRLFGYTAAISPTSALHATMLCRGLRDAAEEALYLFSEVRTLGAAQKFLAAISKHPELARLVRGLRLGCTPNQTEKYISVVREVITKLPRLVTLDLEGLGEICVAETTASDLLCGASLPSLRRIRGMPLYLSPSLLAILRTLPQLEELPVYAYTPVYHPDMDSADIQDGNARRLPDILDELPRLRALSCSKTTLDEMFTAGNITALCITATAASVSHINRISALFGRQILSLRVERELVRYLGMAYPTEWINWNKKFPNLKFLDVQDSGRRKGDCSSERVTLESLPDSLTTLIWSPTWVMDCALIDGRSEEWRRDKIQTFAEVILRYALAVKTVIYRWGNDKFYQCTLVGKDERYHECLAESQVADQYAWADER